MTIVAANMWKDILSYDPEERKINSVPRGSVADSCF